MINESMHACWFITVRSMIWIKHLIPQMFGNYYKCNIHVHVKQLIVRVVHQWWLMINESIHVDSYLQIDDLICKVCKRAGGREGGGIDESNGSGNGTFGECWEVLLVWGICWMGVEERIRRLWRGCVAHGGILKSCQGTWSPESEWSTYSVLENEVLMFRVKRILMKG